MKPCPTFPSIALYPLHDNDGYLEFVLGIWFHTRDIVGPPTAREVRLTLAHFPHERQNDVIAVLERHHQAANEPINWAERIAA